MSITMYELTVPFFIQGVTGLGAVLRKGRDFCAEQRIDDTVLLDARLSPTMFPLARQVQVACEQATHTSAYLAGIEPLPDESAGRSFAQLLARAEAALTTLNGFTPAQLDGSGDRPVSFAIGPYHMSFSSGLRYVQTFALPNFYFHLTTAYGILRHNGVPLGKGDFLGDMGADVTLT